MFSMLKSFINNSFLAGCFFLLSCAQINGNDHKNEKQTDNVVDKEVINENYQAELQQHMSGLRQMDDRNQEIKSRQELKEVKEWLYGSWECGGYDEWVGRYTIYVRITENNLRWGYNGQESYNGPYEINMEESKIYFNRHNGFSTYIKFNPQAERLVNDDGRYFTKVRGLNGNSSPNNYGQGSYNSGYQNNIVQFRNDYDVINYTSSHTFRNNVGNSVKINLQGMYVNGSLVTNAPRVLNFNGSSATISVSSPYMGGGAMIIRVDASRGTITDGSGDVFRMVN